jgi:tetratricopeptide (TPR) repeat protein
VREARVDDAVRAYDEALDARGDVQIYVERAALLERNGRADEAVEGLLAGVHELAGAVVLREELVRLLSATGRRGDALEHANMLVRDADVPARALLLRAGVLDALGRAREARADRERALSEAEAMVARRPSARAVYLRGAALLSLGRIDEARRDLAVAVRRAPHMTEAREALARAERTGGRR